MKVVKARCESEELLVFRSLNLRMELLASDRYYYSNLEKGYEGELEFDRLCEANLSDDWLAVNDLLLEHNNRLFQIDALLLRHGLIFLNDVKNFEGDYFIKEDRWFRASGKEMDDPLQQLGNCESRLRRLLQDLNYSLPIESRLVFVNPEFYLYQAPLNLPIVFPAHLNRYMNQLRMNSDQLTDRDFKLAKKLASLHKKNSPFSRVPAYSYEGLKKGPACCCGHSFMKVHNKEALVCMDCGRVEGVESAVLRNVGELQRLFPEQVITTNIIFDWCGCFIRKRRIRGILMKNYIYQGHGKSAHFVDKQE